MIGTLVDVDQDLLNAVFGQQNRLFSFLISTLWLLVGIGAKTFWDKLIERREELAKLRRDKKLEILEQQLSQFYWPLYLRLEKDNLVWLKVFDQGNSLDPKVRQDLETHFLLKNHEQIVEILESKIYLARAHQALADQIFQYIRHIAIYQAIRKAGIVDQDPMAFGEPFPPDLYRLVKAEKDALQAEYDRLLDLVKHQPEKSPRFRLR